MTSHTDQNAVVDPVLRGMLEDARDAHPERARRESIMVAGFKARWSAAIGLAAMSVAVAVVAVVLLSGPAFTEATASYVRVAQTGIVPALAILAVATAAAASSGVLRTPWAAAVLGIAGSAATALAYEAWYAGVDAEAAATPSVLLLAAAIASVALNGSAIITLLLPAFRRAGMHTGAIVLLSVMVGVSGGAITLLFFFPIFSALLVAAAALLVVTLMHRTERRRTAARTAISASL
jgi:hypothetical protein